MQTHSFGRLTLFDLDPIFIVRYQEGWRVDHFGEVCTHVLDRPTRRVGLVSDVQAIRPAGALARKQMTEIIQPLMKRFEERTVVSVVVSGSTVMRGATRALLWLVPQPYPLIAVETMEQAADELSGYFARESLPVSEATWSALRALGTRPGRGAGAAEPR